MNWRTWLPVILVGAALAAIAIGQAAAPPDDAPPPDQMIPIIVIPAGSQPGSEPATGPASGPVDPNDEATTEPSSQPEYEPATGPASRSTTRTARPTPSNSPRTGGYDPRSRYSRGGSGRTTRTPDVAAVQPAPAPDAPATWDSYSIIATRNIFLKDRRPRTTGPVMGPTDFGPPPAPRESYRLVGFGQLDSESSQSSQKLAFFEELRGGRMEKVAAGDVLDGGRVVSVTLDGVLYEKGGVTKRILIGQGLSGGSVDYTGVSASPSGAGQDPNSPSATSSPSGSGGSSGDSVEERMRRRRAGEIR